MLLQQGPLQGPALSDRAACMFFYDSVVHTTHIIALTLAVRVSFRWLTASILAMAKVVLLYDLQFRL